MSRLRGYFETVGNPVRAVIVMGLAESLPFVGITSLGRVLLKGYDAEPLVVSAGSVKSAGSGVDNNPAELGRLLEEAIRCLDSTDLPGANAAPKKVLVGAALPGSGAALGIRRPGAGSEDRG